jgi:hypothetical protein
VEALTERWYQRQAQTAATTALRVEQLWKASVDPARPVETWPAVEAAALVSSGQAAAAAPAQDYVAASVVSQGERPQADGTVNTQAFVGVAADGRPLTSLLTLPALFTRRYVQQGLSEAAAFLRGQTFAVMVAQTETADAGRLATQVAITNDYAVNGYVRRLHAPSCSRCLILAGRFYSHSDGFLRHPRCDCVHEPYTGPEFGGTDEDTRALIASMSKAQQDKTFGKASAQAIRDGADPAQVVNAKRGMALPGGRGQTPRTTSAGTTRRGSFGRAGTRGERLSVDAIYWQAQGDRAEAIRMLRKYAYILD